MQIKKIYLVLFIFSLFLIPAISFAQGGGACSGPFVTCGNEEKDPCELKDFFEMIAKIYKFIVECLATPLAILAILVGAVMMLISAGNPGLFNTGKTILFSAIIGLVLAYCSYLIIDFVLTAIGYKGPKPGEL